MMEHRVVESSTNNKLGSLSLHSPLSATTDLDQSDESAEQISPIQVAHHLQNSFPALSGLSAAAGQFLSNPFTNADTTTAYSNNTAAFNALGLLQHPLNSMTSGLTAAYPGMDLLSMATATALQHAAHSGLYSAASAENSLHTNNTTWSKVFEQANGIRKRKSSKLPGEEINESLDLSTNYADNKKSKGSPSPTSTSSGEKKDDSYWDRRRKNNEAAKRSRDARRLKEKEVGMRADFLQQENTALKAQIAILRTEFAKLQYHMYNQRPTSVSQSQRSTPPHAIGLIKTAKDH